MTKAGGRTNRDNGAVAQAPAQRIDLFLWYARFAPSRAAAQMLAERGIVRLNGRRIDRAHSPVRPGDLITLPFMGTVRVIRIVQLPARRGPAPEARECFEDIETGEAQSPC